MLKVAVIGSGPSGCYAADRIARKAPFPVEVDIFDRLPTPFGLVRAGVSPDHQSIKIIARVMTKAMERPPVRYFGNVEIGRDLELAELRDCYDCVLIAVGAAEDRPLDIPGDDLAGVVGSGAFTRWYNDHPDAVGLEAGLDRAEDVVVIGNGNVAVDVTRMLAKSLGEYEGSDLSPDVGGRLDSAAVRRITVVGRRDARHIKFSPAELRELGELVKARLVIDPVDVAYEPGPDEGLKAYEVLKGLAEEHANDPRKPVEIRFRFNLSPEEVLDDGEGRVGGMRFRKTLVDEDGRVHMQDDSETLDADIVIPCIGYTTRALDALPLEKGRIPNEDGKVDDGLYVVGWAKRGPSGTIGTNRPESQEIADRIMAECTDGGKEGRARIVDLLEEKGVPYVTWDGWKRIDEAERARAGEGRVRRKFTRYEDFASIAKGEGG